MQDLFGPGPKDIEFFNLNRIVKGLKILEEDHQQEAGCLRQDLKNRAKNLTPQNKKIFLKIYKKIKKT
ncbi:MAG: hypothetical protein UU24_C0023G0008 [Candidatus Nomurabacteria bacterium GW2011_GWA2_40_9]|uniref:Uncharacterized protein n=1 Tax=Candidatus Nomurabacteria bacterium GW2011_GWA2_40_9 TaxID=1618734 RepID=A0A0G0TVN0_9BACT|nr:MAG: hypothetical protein UU24_C0023G0008 [Candidatus Nomurabacteria bacterium GW2011_GWA2_40_9]